jgi:hypothetical protein
VSPQAARDITSRRRVRLSLNLLHYDGADLRGNPTVIPLSDPGCGSAARAVGLGVEVSKVRTASSSSVPITAPEMPLEGRTR